MGKKVKLARRGSATEDDDYFAAYVLHSLQDKLVVWRVRIIYPQLF